MKVAVILLAVFAGANANATTINCARDAFSVTAELVGTKAPYILSKDGAEVIRGELDIMAAEYDFSFLNAFVIALQSEDAVLGVAIPGIKNLKTPGTYQAKADLFIPSPAGDFDGSTVSCSVTVN